MFGSKQRVDKHVATILGRIKDEKEKFAKGYQIAKMYYDVREYEMARRYLSMFLGVKEKFPMAHKLMGEIMEKQNNPERALESYRRSYQLDDKQKDVVFKICEIYCQIDVDPERARYWAEKAEKIDPKHSVVYRLRERIYAPSDSEPCSRDLEMLITDELVKRPHDASLRMRLLRLYVDQERINEAYDHVIHIELRRPYHDNLEWYQTVLDVLEIYQEESGARANGSFHYHLLLALSATTGLSMNKSLASATDALSKFDASLQSACKQDNNSQEWPEFLAEMKAVYFYHAGTLLLKRCMKEKQDWSRCTRPAAACYLASYGTDRPDTQARWYAAAGPDRQHSFQHWCDGACDRLSQIGHVLSNMSRDHGSSWLTDVKNELFTTQGVQLLFNHLYGDSSYRNQRKSSFLLQNPNCVTGVAFRLPIMDQLREYDQVAHLLYPDNLSRLVWIAVQYNEPKQTQPDYHFRIFDKLQLSTKAVENSAPESLCQLDVDAFLYATVHNALTGRHQKQKLQRKGCVQFDHLPFILSDQLCSDAQAQWWRAAYKLYMNSAKENLAGLRLTLLRGLEVIRVMGQHGLDTKLVVELAKIFQLRESDILSRSSDPLDYVTEAEQYRARARLYWSKALDMMSKTGRRVNGRPIKDVLFAPLGEELTPIQIRDYKRDANFYLACDLMKSGQLERAVEAFDDLVTPYASYNQAKIYMQLSEDEFGNRSLEALTPEQKDQYVALLDKAREAYYTTLDRLRSDKHHVLHQILATEMADVENQLAELRGETVDGEVDDFTPLGGADVSRLRPSSVNACSTPYRPDLNVSRDVTVSQRYVNNTMTNGVPTTPETSRPPRARPSPERLEAQIRCLQQSQEKIITSVQDSIKQILGAHTSMQTEIRELRTTMDQIRVKLDELSLRQMAVPPPQYPPQFPPCPPQMTPQMYQDFLKYGTFVPHHYTPSLNSPHNPALSSLHNLAQVSTSLPSEPYKNAPVNVCEGDFDEEEYFNEEGDFFDENTVADSDLIQEWPFGAKSEMKGSSTVTYQPQTGLPGPGFFARDTTDSRSKQGLLGHAPLQGTSSLPLTSHSSSGLPGHVAQPPPPGATASFGSVTTPGKPAPSSVKTPLDAAKTRNGAAKTSPIVGHDGDANRSVSISSEAHDDSYDPHFSPVIALPDKVETYTGEEGETVLYETAKAKLFRFVEGQWKERGTGPVKLLQNAEKRVRFVMRREQVLKICANHFLDKNMTLTVSEQCKNAVLWFADDFADDQVRNEKFCLRFGTEEVMKEFQAAFNKALKSLKDDTAQAPKAPAFVSKVEKAEEAKQVPKPAFGTPVRQGPVSESTGSPFSGFLFRLQPTESKPFGSAEPKGVFGFGQADSTNSPIKSDSASTIGFGQCKFGQTPATAFKLDTGTNSSNSGELPKMVFGQHSGMESFSSLVSKADAGKTSPVKGSPFTSGSGMFAAGKSPKSPGAVDDPHHFEAQSDFKPLIALPELVKFSTGEEDETKLFGERGKLYRMDPDSKTWKERGVGEIKIMKNSSTNRCRIIMRREQVHKVCANHVITEDMKLVKMGTSTKAWCWFAHDFSDPEEPTTEQFAIRFKNEDLAASFREVFEDCQRSGPNKDGSDKSSDSVASKKEQATKAGPVLPTPGSDVKSASIFDKFKQKDDEWECQACLIRNKVSSHNCVACQTRNPDAPEPEEVKPSDGASQFGSSSPGAGFKFGSASTSFGSFGSSFAGGASSKTSTGTGLFGSAATGFKMTTADSGSASGTGFTFGSGTTSTPSPFGASFGGAKTSLAPTSKPPLSGSLFSITPSGPPSQGGFAFGTGPVTKPDPVSTTGSLPAVTTSAFSFGQSSSSSTFTFGQNKSTPMTAFSFGAKSNEGSDVTKTPEKSNLFTQGLAAPGASFTTPTPQVSLTKFSTSTPVSSPQVSIPPSTPVLAAPLPGGFKFGETTSFNFSGVTPSKPDPKSPSPAKALSPKSPDDHYHQEEDDSHIYFEPIVPLPDKVEVESGEENETEKFAHRAKLYRFINNEWKERGLGVVKVLEHNDTKKLRVVMRREQVKKLCLNHYISPEMVLTPMKGGKNAAWVWSAMDFAEGEPTPEQFCIRFRSPEIANDFKEAFESCSKNQSLNVSAKSADNFSFKLDDNDISDTRVADGFSFKSPGTSTPGFSFGDRFKSSPSAGAAVQSPFGSSSLRDTGVAATSDDDDDCAIVRVVMPSDDDIALARKYKLPDTFYNYKTLPDCPGCAGCRDEMPTYKYDDDVTILSILAASPGSVQRARTYKLPDNFYLYEKKPPCKGCRGCQDCSKKDDSKTTTTNEATSSTPSASGGGASGGTSQGATGSGGAGIFGSSGSGVSTFADLAHIPQAGFTHKDSDKPFAWAGAGAAVFGAGEGGAGDDSVTTDDPHYDPIIDLPDIVETTTGEENEDCVWSHRCKLYRYDPDNKAWKERAIGDIKILKHKESVRYRLVMRREQVKKMALNHVLGLDLDLQPMATSDTSWCWYAHDYSDPAQSDYEQFAVRFKTPEIAKIFRDHFDECQRRLRDDENGTERTESEPAPSIGDVKSVEPDDDEEEEEDYEDVEEDEPLFEKRVSLVRRVNNQPEAAVLGTLTVYEADYGYGTKIGFEDDEGVEIADHFIAMETKIAIDKSKRTAEWNGLNFSDGSSGKHTLYTASFSSASAMNEFHEIVNDCIEGAKEMKISEHDLVTEIRELDQPEVVGVCEEPGQ